MKLNQGNLSVKPLHMLAATLLLITGILRFESGAGGIFFLVTGFLALICSLSSASFLSKPRMDALVLWLEAVCFLLAALAFFNSGKVLLPWIMLLLAVVYAFTGWKNSGIK